MKNLIIDKSIFGKEADLLQKLEDESLHEILLGILRSDDDIEESDKRMPCGYTKTQIASVIKNRAKEYVATRDDMLENCSEYTDEELKEILVDKLADCSDDERIAVLANLNLFFEVFSSDIDEKLTEKVMQEKYEKLISGIETTDKAQIADDLLSSLQLTESTKLLRMCDVVREEISKGGALDKQVLSNVSEAFASENRIAIRSALIYNYISKGMLEGVNPNMDPGLVTSYVAATSDTAVAKFLGEKNLATEIALDKIFKIISTAFTIVVSISIVALIITAGVGGTALLAQFAAVLVGWGMIEDAALVVVSLLIFILVYICGGLLNIYHELQPEIEEKLYHNCRNILSSHRWNTNNLEDGYCTNSDDEYYEEMEGAEEEALLC